MTISDSKRADIRELAQEILQATNDDEFDEACRAIVETIKNSDADAT